MGDRDNNARVAGPDDLRRIGDTFTRAFHDDPIWRWLVHRPSQWSRGVPFVFRLATREHLGNGTVWVSSDVSAAAVWAPPGHRDSQLRQIPALPRLLTVFGTRSVAGLRFHAAMHRFRPVEPHWYLAVLGTDPAHQGKGHASAVLAPVLERCDTEGIGAYLESSKEANLPYYRRHGFELIRAEQPVDAAPPMYLMWRDPR